MLSPLNALGGGPRHARSLARSLSARGVRVSLLCLTDGSVMETQPGDSEFASVDTLRPVRWPVLWRLSPLADLPRWAAVVRRTTRKVDLVVSLSAPLACATRLARPRLPLVFAPAMLRRNEYPDQPDWRYEQCERWALRLASGVLARSDATHDVIRRLYGDHRRPTRTALPYVDASRVRTVARGRVALGVPVEAKVLLTVGAINANKGHALIARAFGRHADADWWWVVVGAGPDRDAVWRSADAGRLHGRVRFVAPTDAIGDWLAAADVLVTASKQETFGQTIAEAWLAGRPAVLPRNGAGVLSPLAEHVERHALGALFTRGDDVALIDAIRSALRIGACDEKREAIAGFASRAFTGEAYAAAAIELANGRRGAADDVALETCFAAGAEPSRSRARVVK